MMRVILLLLAALFLAGCVTMTQSTYAQLKDAWRLAGRMECLAERPACVCQEGK